MGTGESKQTCGECAKYRMDSETHARLINGRFVEGYWWRCRTYRDHMAENARACGEFEDRRAAEGIERAMRNLALGYDKPVATAGAVQADLF